MTTDGQLYRLLTWLSPAFPIGAYAFSHGLEQAVELQLVHDMATARDWIADLITFGGAQSDLVFLAAAWQAGADADRLAQVHELALALAPTAEIRLETTAQGTAFVKAAAAAWPCSALDSLCQVTKGEVALPVAVGVLARGHQVELAPVMLAFGQAFVANLVSAAVRLIPLGQTQGQMITAALFDGVSTAAARARATPLEEVTSSCLMVDIMSMQHEVQYTRLFRS